MAHRGVAAIVAHFEKVFDPRIDRTKRHVLLDMIVIALCASLSCSLDQFSGRGSLYMRRFILGWKVLGHEQRFQAKIVNYADDLVICCRRNADQAMDAMRSIFRKLKLTVNEEKTHVCQIPHGAFDFLGYTFGRCYSSRTGNSYVSQRPSKRKIQAVCRRISEVTSRQWCWRDTEEQVRFTRDRERLVVATKDAVIVLDADTGKEIVRLEHSGWVTALSCSPGGDIVAIGDNRGALTLWNFVTGQSQTLPVPGSSGYPWTLPTALFAIACNLYWFVSRKSKGQEPP